MRRSPSASGHNGGKQVWLAWGNGVTQPPDLRDMIVEDQALLARLSTTMVLMRPDGDLVYFIPEPLKAPIARMIAEQPASPP